ncbi:MAG: hypothetical protein KAS67_06340 [Thermoplasmata archaeon]|nr:hypothetical protein [Thermoplasmata archaeon]
MKGSAFSLFVAALLISCSLAFVLTGQSIAQDMDIVYVDEGGFYVSGPYDSYTVSEIWVNATVVSGGNIDVYLMTYIQAENAYPGGPYGYYDPYAESPEERDPKAVSFSSLSKEDVSSASIYYKFPETTDDYYGFPDEGIFVIIDNRDCSLTPNDADATGQVTVELSVESSISGFPFMDPFTGLLWPMVIMAIAGLGFIILIIVLVMASEKKKRKEPVYPPQPYDQAHMYQQPGQPPPGQTPEQQPSYGQNQPPSGPPDRE